MIQLFPPPSDHRDVGDGSPIDDVVAAVDAEDRTPPDQRPWIFTNMIVSADGATAVDGLSGGLGSDGDRMMFRALRAQADVILAGAATARHESYRPPQLDEATRTRRTERGREPRPRLALVSGSLQLDAGLALFNEPDPRYRPYVITSQRSMAAHGGDIEQRATVIVAGRDDIDLGRAMVDLASRGVGRVLCEGGPNLNGQLVTDDLIDEWNLTIAPLLVSSDSKRAAVGQLPGGPPAGMRLARVWTADHYLFCRWVRAGSG